ncbi:TlpA disulfide reductase family protein [Nitrosomonas sp.]|uniref:TlpA disulfide reductase family protein n=1 Tax=Nitrosomonas sp. TaxID=42353 RepID=UPI001D80E194|nr:TlpA disulfide reductase family protein [Nitrosomonas sp.]MBX3617085.1 TlpA family protein disulfide reductase [Nitrosomonas sp.]
MKKIRLLGMAALLFLGSTSLLAEHLERISSACDLTTLDGKPALELQDLRGKVVYMDFWASWCPPCVKSFAFLNQLEQEMGEQGVHVIGVNLDEKVKDAQEFLTKHPANFSIVADPSKECAKALEVMAMPTSYIIDKKGNIRHVHQGFRPGETEELRALVTQLVDERP